MSDRMANVIAKRRSRRSNLLLLVTLLSGACSSDDPPAPAAIDPVIVYIAYEDTVGIRDLLDRYSDATGVPIIDRRGAPAAIVDDLVENRVEPPADLLLTRSVVGAWRAAEESALRPLYSDVVAQHVPGWAADPDRFWHATAMTEAVVAYGGDEPVVSELADLGHDRFYDALCLSSSVNEVNRAVIAMRLAQAGGNTRPVELMVRRWVMNLAAPPFPSEEQLAAAIADGQCGLGLISRPVAERAGLRILELPDPTANIEAVGVGRHARNPDGAARLAEWLITRSEWAADTATTRANVGEIGRHYAEAVLLAERARYP